MKHKIETAIANKGWTEYCSSPVIGEADYGESGLHITTVQPIAKLIANMQQVSSVGWKT